MNSKNYIDVLIDGKICTLGGLEEESYLQQVAIYLNEKISQLRKQGGFEKQPEDYQNVMVYLNVADDYFKAREHAGMLADQREELERETYRLKQELVSTRMKTEALKKEYEAMREELERCRAFLAAEQAVSSDAGKTMSEAVLPEAERRVEELEK